MSTNEPMSKIGCTTLRISVTDASGSTPITIPRAAKHVILSNNGPGLVFSNTGAPVTFPVAGGAAVNGKICLAGLEITQQTNSPADTQLFAVCPTGATADFYISFSDGV